MTLGKVGRNLSLEIDKVRRMMKDMSETQSRLEAILRDIRESINSLNLNKRSTEVGAPVGVQLNYLNEHSPCPTSVVVPINKKANCENSSDVAPTWEQPQVSIPQQPTRPGSKSGYETSQMDKMKEDWMERMEEQIKAIKGTSDYEPLRIEELCLVNDVVIPKGFELPKFSKYNGSGNPRFHLVSYGTKMAIWSTDDKFLISLFHESLTGPALEWYLQLDRSKISRWTELAELFMDQYKFNLDTVPTREQLSIMQKEGEESFRRYAQRWRMLAAQVQPPLIEFEMYSYFIGTLGAPFIELMAGVAYRDFFELISAGERIESLVKAGKLPNGHTESNSPKRVTEQEISYV